MNDQAHDLPVILVVDDSKVIRRAATKMLGGEYNVLEAVDGSDAWHQLQHNSAISIVFADLAMLNMGGMELLENIRACEDDRISALPLVVMTGEEDTEAAKHEVFAKGATDFIVKPFQSIDLLCRAKSYVGLSCKVVELEKKAGYDKLTGLYDISRFEELGQKAISFSQRHKLHVTCLAIEIDDFKDAYLEYGKNAAQQILLTVSDRLQNLMRSEDLAARVGVSKFAVLLPMTSHVKSIVVIDRILESIDKLVFNIGNETIRVTLSIGCSHLDHDSVVDIRKLMRQTDDALSRAASKTSDVKVVSFIDEDKLEGEINLDSEQLKQALEYVLQGEYYRLNEHMLWTLADRLRPFMAYVAEKDRDQATPQD